LHPDDLKKSAKRVLKSFEPQVLFQCPDWFEKRTLCFYTLFPVFGLGAMGHVG
jgi:hypothetical protein